MSESSTDQKVKSEITKTSLKNPEEGNVDTKPISQQGVKVVVLDTPDQLLDHARKILSDAKRPEWNDVSIDKKLEVFQDKYKEFGRTFPIVLRHIVQSQKLYPKILERYILRCKHHPTHSVDEFQERQAEYLVMIYRQEHPRCSQRELNMVKKRHVDDLKREEEYMKKVMEEVKKERDEKSKQYDIARRTDLLGLIDRCINDVPEDIDISLDEKRIEAEKAAKRAESADDDNNEVESLVLFPEKKEK
jgi:ribosomal protein L44E